MTYNERNMTICEMRDNGATFAEIARELGISTERARQIYVAHKAMEERDDTPMYRALCEAAEDAGRPYPERAASRAYHYLVRSGITELAQLADYSDSQLLKIRCFGIGSLEIARAAQAKAAEREYEKIPNGYFEFDLYEIARKRINEYINAEGEAAFELALADFGYVKERTCKNTQSDLDFMCSECGKCVDNGRVIKINYCPNCGAKVVE